MEGKSQYAKMDISAFMCNYRYQLVKKKKLIP